MKNIILLMIVFLFSSISCFAQGNLSSKINLSGAGSVAAKANSESSFGSSPFSNMMQDPMMQGMLNGYYSTMQGMTGASYQAQEQQKQQMDYAKQQTNYVKQMDSE